MPPLTFVTAVVRWSRKLAFGGLNELRNNVQIPASVTPSLWMPSAQLARFPMRMSGLAKAISSRRIPESLD